MSRRKFPGTERRRTVSSTVLALSLAIAAAAKAQESDTPAAEPAASEVTSVPAPEPAQAVEEQARAETEELATIPVDVPEQTEPTADAKTPSKNRFVEEIVVTAQKREENAQDVPISVTAFSGDLLEAKGIDDPSKLSSVTPGLTYNIATGFTFIYIRGIGSDAFLTADPSVASYIDGVYYPFSSGLSQSFGKVERVEVLKGPQGTLFGRNSTGGAISITTETPSTSFNGSIETAYSRFNTSKPTFSSAAHWASTSPPALLASITARTTTTASQRNRFSRACPPKWQKDTGQSCAGYRRTTSISRSA